MAGLLDDIDIGGAISGGLLGFAGGAPAVMQLMKNKSAAQQQKFENDLKLRQLQMLEKQNEERPQYQKLKDALENERLLKIEPYGRGISDVTPKGQVDPAMAGIPAGVNPKEMLKERAKVAAKLESDLAQSAKVASFIAPKFDQMVKAYEDTIAAGGIGPITGSEPGRLAGKLFHTDAEAARQKYEMAKAPISAYITSAANKGQGPVSEWERKMYGLSLPGFDALKPQEQLEILKSIRDEIGATVKAGKATPIGQASGMSDIYNYGGQQPARQGQTQQGSPRNRVSDAFGAQPAQAQAMPRVGEVRDGYRYSGGDPASPRSWTRQ